MPRVPFDPAPPAAALRVPLRRALVVALSLAALAACGVPARAETVTEVTVERVKPKREKHETLRFLKENRDFIRARYDLLREETRERRAESGPIDPRYLEYQAMLADIHAARDSVASVDEARARQQLLESVTQLGGLEARLDLLDSLLARQRARLGVIQEDFTGDQRTALLVVVSGSPGAARIAGITLALEDGQPQVASLTDEQRESLRQGGVLQLFHGFVEPREQTLAVTVAGEAWPSGDTGYVTLEPARDRLTFLRLDLSALDAARGAASLRASTWLHDASLHTADAPTTAP
jgi:hypothetical protein